ncbi:MAG: cation:proton antiporter [Gammaproteobacteria bacterium]|nr:cation:proton antiporter [Gammaproteobacteria bacterium]MCP5459233.1 cation:proton antiporter [Gammaproteobacteria bacterium]
MPHSNLTDILTLLALSVVMVAALRKLNLPPILGYLCVGVLVGPNALGWLEDSATTHLLGEIGVVFLLFTLGLEFSIPQLLALRKPLLGLGGAQVLGAALSGGLIAWASGISAPAALVMGGALAMSSTAIVVKQLTEQLELQSLQGRLALGILLFQDLAAVPFLVMIPILAGESHTLGLALSMAFGKGVVACVSLLALGRWLLRPLFHQIAASRSAELFTLTVLLVSLAAAWVTYLLGLSLALGAFLAGMMLSETEYRHQIESDIRPFRDVLLGLFFIIVGMQLAWPMLPTIWPWVLLLTLGLVLGKGLFIALLTRLAGYDRATALRTGAVLAQGGEFGFALLALALQQGLVNDAQSQPILASIIVSMALAPLIIRHNSLLSKALFATQPGGAARQAREIASATRTFQGHVIICGFGRIGQNMARFLRDEGFTYVALDLEPGRIKAAWEAGEWVFYGDATHRDILQAAGMTQARALIITFADPRSALRILRHARSLRKDLPILVRTRDDTNLDQLLEEGATEVVPETLESSLMLAVQLLLLLEVPIGRVVRRMRQVRGDRYQMLRMFFRRSEAERRPEMGRDHERLRSVFLPSEAFAVDKPLGELRLTELGVSITAVRRAGIRGDEPLADLRLAAGDILVLGGTPEQLARAEERLLKGWPRSRDTPDRVSPTQSSK